jgi:hypothetical protein
MGDLMSWASSDVLREVASKSTVLLVGAWVVDVAFLRRRLLAADVLWRAVPLGLIALPLPPSPFRM